MSLRILSVLLVLLALAAHARADVVHLHTREVEALALHDGGLWVASTGGLERYALTSLRRTHHFTTADGLDAPHVRALAVREGQLVAHTEHAACRLAGAQLACVAEPYVRGDAAADSLGTFLGAPITARLTDATGRSFLATYGSGVFVEQGDQRVRLTPDGQVCTHHVQAAARFRGALFLGGFRDGLCVRRGRTFAPVEAPVRLVNELRVHRGLLYVAAHEGLFVSRDGVHFRRELRIDARGANGLASVGDTLWISAPGVLYALPPHGRAHVLLAPGGTRSIQAITADASGVVWLATEDRGLVRIDTQRGDAERPHVEVIDALRGLGSSWLVDVALAPEGVYAATLRDGLYRVQTDGKVESVPGTPRWLLRLARDGDGLWIGSQEGLVHRAADGAIAQVDGLPDARVHRVLDDGRLRWIATEHGLVEQTRSAQ